MKKFGQEKVKYETVRFKLRTKLCEMLVALSGSSSNGATASKNRSMNDFFNVILINEPCDVKTI